MDQYSDIKYRNIHSAIWDAKQRMIENGSDWSLVGINWKAFDRVDRTYIFQVIRKMKFPESFMNIIEKIYRNTNASLIVNGHLTKRIKQTRGVRKGCSLFAVDSITTFEPFLESLRSKKSFQRSTDKRIIAYADDISFFAHKDDIDALFEKTPSCDGTVSK